jgi:membrane protease YdiL (CAAX protease family)
MDKLVVLHALYLFYVLIVLSWAVLRTRRKLGAAAAARAGGAPAPSRERILASTLFSLALLFGMSWMVADLSGIELFAVPALVPLDYAAAAAAFGGHFAMRRLAIALHTREELRRSPLLVWMPRTPRQWALWVPVAITAGLAEEAAYRGVAWSLLTHHTGHAWLSAAICIAAFALHHVTQSWKSVVAIAGIAVFMHALVAFTGTLVLAMGVHALYDLVVAVLIARRAAQLELEGAAVPSPGDPGRAPSS